MKQNTHTSHIPHETVPHGPIAPDAHTSIQYISASSTITSHDLPKTNFVAFGEHARLHDCVVARPLFSDPVLPARPGPWLPGP